MMMQLHHRLRRNNWLSFCCLILAAVAISFVFVKGSFAAEKSQQVTDSSQEKSQEILDLPSFRPEKNTTPDTPIRLELLPESEAGERNTKAESAPIDTAKPVTTMPLPAPIQQDPISPSTSAPISKVAETLPPRAETQTASPEQEIFGPPMPPRRNTAATTSTDPLEIYGPSLPVATAQAPKNASSPATETFATKLAPVDPSRDIIPDGWKEGSLMFTEAELQKLREALIAPPPAETVSSDDPNAPATQTATATTKGKKVPAPDYAAFYVNSILYHGEGQWSVWMNGRKFYPEEASPLERVLVETVTARTITFRWKPANPLNVPAEYNRSHIDPQPDGTVLITLATNQTVLTGKLEVLEGRTLTPEIRALIAANTTAMQAALTAPSADERDRKNVDKLISQYQAAQSNNASP